MSRRAISIVSGAIFSFGASGFAFAADMAVKAPPKPTAPAPVYSWTGCYVGVNGGYVWNRARSTYIDDPNAFFGDPILGLGSVLPPSYDTSSNSGLGGGQVGCNWQSGLWVLGIEGDIDGMNLSKTVGLVTGIDQVNGTRISTGQILVGNDSVIASEHVSQHWLSTVRGRLGFAPMQQLYIYGTGGLAIGGVSMNGSVIGEGAGAAIVWSGSSSDTKAGYAVGGGAEYAINDHWSLKGEYIYFDLGTVSHPLGLVSNTIVFSGIPFSTLGNTATRINGNIVRVGLNYQFH